MRRPASLLRLLGIIVVVCVVGCAQGQEYLFTAPADTQFIPYQQQNQNQFQPSQIIPFRQVPAGFQAPDASSTYFTRDFSSHQDLQTSDLSLLQQQTLPQFRFTTDEPFGGENVPSYTFQNNHPTNRVVNTPVGFRPSKVIKPTTLRPNYSHLFAKSHHNHDPSQTETFLGQITLQNPIESPPQFDEFKPSEAFPQKSQEITSNAALGGLQDDSTRNSRPSENSIQLNARPSFLNHRSRIFAPDTTKTTRSQVKNYFVNNNGDVYITTKIPFSPKPTTPTRAPVTVSRRNNFSPATKPTGKPLAFNLKPEKKGFVPKNQVPTPQALKSLDLEPLLEEPLKDGFGQNNDDGVEVIKSDDEETTEVTTEETTFFAITTDVPYSETVSQDSSPSEEVANVNITTAPLLTTLPSTEPQTTVLPEIHEENNTEIPGDYNYSEEVYDDSEERSNVSNENDIQNEYSEHSGEVTDKDDYNSKEKQLEELKTEPVIQTTLSPDPTYEVITMKPSRKMKEYDFHDFVDTVSVDSAEAQSLIETTTVPVSVSMSSSVAIKKGDQIISGEMMEDEPEVVISVVTSKTVVNNTVIASATPAPPVTTALGPTTEASMFGSNENTTDTWVVVASVQTSRSVSGARYLPSSIVEQEERVKLLNEHSTEDEDSSKEDYSGSAEYYQDNYEDPANNTSKEVTSGEETKSLEQDTTILPTSTKARTSTESLIDKLDRVQSDLSSGLLTGGLDNNIAVIKENMSVDVTTMVDMGITTSTTTKAPYPQVNIRKFSPANRPSTTKRPRPGDRTAFKPKKSNVNVNQPQSDQPQAKLDISSLLPADYKFKASDDKSSRLLDEILSKAKRPKVEATSESNVKEFDISKLLPPGYKPPAEEEEEEKPTTQDSLFKNTKADDISKFLPPGYKLPTESEEKVEKPSTEGSIFKNTKADDISKFLPPGYKLGEGGDKTTAKPSTESSIFKNTKADDISKFLPPGYKVPKSETKMTTESSSIFKNTKADDVSKFLPKGYRLPKTTTTTESTAEKSILPQIKTVDVSSLLPPGYRPPKDDSSNNLTPQSIDINSLLPPDYKQKLESGNNITESQPSAKNVPSNLLPPDFKGGMTESPSTTTKSSGGFKVVFPSRPGGGARKSATRTTPRSFNNDEPAKPTSPTILKGWPSRATTEFTGWPTPSTTPISIEKLLEAARTASTSTTQTIETTITTSTTTTTTTTTTPRPTTPGVCVDECDLAGTIKLVGGAKWVPELLDRNTKEWQILANEVQTQLDDVYSSSPLLSKWYKKIRIDGFSEGSVLVDYLVELNDLGRSVNTQEMKRLFHDSLDSALTKSPPSREGKALNESAKLEGKLALGNFVVDPKYTDFVVLPKQNYPTMGYAENDVLLPQWAIAVIVIGLASLLFVIIFGVTVLVNRQKNSKKKTPTPLTEDMLNELNKNHMGGFDNYGADDLYNMEDVWNDRGYDQKPPKKRSNGSIHDNSMSNLYDSWRSEWNGYYYNAYYGNNPGSSHSGYGRRRSDYDTNF